MTEHFRTFANIAAQGQANMKANMAGVIPPKGGYPECSHGRAPDFQQEDWQWQDR